jgi:hypothetical protein
VRHLFVPRAEAVKFLKRVTHFTIIGQNKGLVFDKPGQPLVTVDSELLEKFYKGTKANIFYYVRIYFPQRHNLDNKH